MEPAGHPWCTSPLCIFAKTSRQLLKTASTSPQGTLRSPTRNAPKRPRDTPHRENKERLRLHPEIFTSRDASEVVVILASKQRSDQRSVNGARQRQGVRRWTTRSHHAIKPQQKRTNQLHKIPPKEQIRAKWYLYSGPHRLLTLASHRRHGKRT